MSDNPALYNADSIEVLPPRKAIQLRPGMYLGSAFTIDALYRLIAWVVEDAVDPTSSNNASRVDIVLERGNWVTISDNGDGLPVALNNGENPRPIIEVTFTHLLAGADTPERLKYFGFPLYDGAVLNILSAHMIVQTHRDGALYEISFKDGVLAKPLSLIAPSTDRGTIIRFQPEMSLFSRKYLRLDRLSHILDATRTLDAARISKHAVINLSRKQV